MLLLHSWVSIPALPYLGFLSFRPTTVDSSISLSTLGLCSALFRVLGLEKERGTEMVARVCLRAGREDSWSKMAELTVGPPSGLGHHHVMSAPLGVEREHRNQTGSDIDVPFGDRSKKDAFRKGRAYKKGNWTAAEILVLQVSLLSTCCQSPPNSSLKLKKMFYAFVGICCYTLCHRTRWL